MQTRAWEILVNAGGITPLWNGEEYEEFTSLTTYEKLEESYMLLRESHGRRDTQRSTPLTKNKK